MRRVFATCRQICCFFAVAKICRHIDAAFRLFTPLRHDIAVATPAAAIFAAVAYAAATYAIH